MHTVAQAKFNTLVVDDCVVSYAERGAIGRLPLLLMHGLGPGASVSGAFVSIMPFLEQHFHVFAMDLVGFGNSGRKKSPPFFDFPLWVKQARAVLDVMPKGKVGIFGHSASGAIALQLAASDPRVAAVITTGTAGTRFKVNEHLARLWTLPRSKDELRLSLRSLIHDADNISEQGLEARWSVLQAPGYGDYFSAMFSGDKQQLANTWVIGDDQLERIEADYTLVHGRDDLPCPPEETSLQIAERVKHANVVLLSRCGHAPALEAPEQVIAAIRLAFTRHVPFDA